MPVGIQDYTFDVDFSDQDAIFFDLQRKYGAENVARIIAFGKMTPKAVVRKVLNCFEHDVSTQNLITKLIPDTCETMQGAYTASPDLLTYKNKFRTEFSVIERLEGTISHESQHAGGVIIHKNLSSFLPIKTRGEDRTKRIVAFDKYMLEEIGAYKFDILGLETLPLIRHTLDSIQAMTGDTIDLHHINMEDSKVYDMLCQGDVSGVFQLAAQAQKVIEQQPRSFNDLIAINALIRPGVGDWNTYIERRKGKEWKIHASRMPYLEETKGLITYQEQFLLDAKVLAGWDIAYADKKIRKNKDIKNDHELRSQFISDAVSRGHEESEVQVVWSEIEDAVAGGLMMAHLKLL